MFQKYFSLKSKYIQNEIFYDIVYHIYAFKIVRNKINFFEESLLSKSNKSNKSSKSNLYFINNLI
jgi:hypothetical protein